MGSTYVRKTTYVRKPILPEIPVPLLSSMDWGPRAACRDHAPELFDELPRVPYLFDFARLDQAIEICAGCPVRDECLAFGVTHKTSGVHGGYMLVAGQPIEQTSLERRLRAAERREAQLARRRRQRVVA